MLRPTRITLALPAFTLLMACSGGRGGGHMLGGDGSASFDLAGNSGDLAGLNPGDGGQSGCQGEANGCYSVYACSDTELYVINLMTKSIVDVGPFNAPKVGGSADTMTDLAVAPDNTIYVISHTQLYTASATTGQVTTVGTVSTCGSDNVGLTFDKNGNLFAADYTGKFCQIGYQATPLTLTQLGPIGGGMAIAGDIVAIDDGTMYGTALDLTDGGTASPTAKNNLLIKINPTTGMSSEVIGSTGYPELYGVSYALGQVFGFTHDGSGDVITIDPMTGTGTPFGTFTDPTSKKGITFAGAGVNSMVPSMIQ